MSVRLVLATSPVCASERYGAFAGAGSTEPSFGLVCLAAVAQQAGAVVTVVESSALELRVDTALQAILAAEPDIAGFTATTSEVLRAAELAAALKAKRPGVLTVLGGCHVTALPADTLEVCPAFDMAVIGEGEETLRELLGRVAAGDLRPMDLPGTAVRVDGRIVVNPARAAMDDLDALPLPAWSLLPGFPGAFRPSPGRIRRWPCASIVLTRGCPNTCVFCDRSVFGNRCRAYSPAYAVRLVRELYERHGVRELLIEDDTFVIVKTRVREFCERLIDARLDISWSCLGRADRVDPDLLRLMRRAGCWHISYGIESGDEAILAAMHKRLDLDQIRQAVAWSREAGLRTKGFFIVGFPGETPASLARTRSLALSLPLDDISVMQMTPFPGSELYRIAGEYGVVDRDWRRMNVLNTVFVPHGFTRADLERARGDLLRAFYRRPDVLWRQLAHVAAHPRLIPSTWRGLRAFRRVTGGGGMKFTIVTPSLNQGAFIERTLRSIYAQRRDVDVEHVVVDGGSTDGTVDILRRYEGQSSWTSGPDQGQSDAINRGLRRATGDILAWLNSDDVYEPGALAAVADAYRTRPFQWAFGNCRIVDENDREIRRVVTAYKIRQSRRYSYRRLLRRDFIPQPAAFFTRAAFEQTGDLDGGLHYSMDYDYWLRLGRRWAPCYLDRTLAGFRWHTRSKNGSAYRAAARESFHTAQRHARPGEGFDIFMHRLHVLALGIVYRCL